MGGWFAPVGAKCQEKGCKDTEANMHACRKGKNALAKLERRKMEK